MRILRQHLKIALFLNPVDFFDEYAKLDGAQKRVRFQIANAVDDGFWVIFNEVSPKDLAEWVGKEALALFVGVVRENSFKIDAVLVEVVFLTSPESKLVINLCVARNVMVKQQHEETDVSQRSELTGNAKIVQIVLDFGLRYLDVCLVQAEGTIALKTLLIVIAE